MKLIISFFTLFLIAQVSHACSACVIHKGKEMVVGKNLDWFTDLAMLVVNKRNVSKKAYLVDTAGKAVTWTSKYGSVTFNPNGVGSPSGGMNEVGLVIEESALGSSKYPAADKRPAINEIQWIQYQLDNCKTVDEVIASDSKLRIVRYYYVSHYFIYDRKGNALTVDAVDGKLVFNKIKKEGVQVLTNHEYAKSLDYLKKIDGFGGSLPLPQSTKSLDRFCKAADMISKFKNNDTTGIVPYAFDVLKAISVPGTAWSVVYDVKNLAIHLKTAKNPSIQQVNLKALDFRCNTPLTAFDINQNQSGDVTGKFSVFTTAMNKEFVAKVIESWRKAKFALHITDADVLKLGEYPDSMSCAK